MHQNYQKPNVKRWFNPKLHICCSLEPWDQVDDDKVEKDKKITTKMVSSSVFCAVLLRHMCGCVLLFSCQHTHIFNRFFICLINFFDFRVPVPRNICEKLPKSRLEYFLEQKMNNKTHLDCVKLSQDGVKENQRTGDEWQKKCCTA